MLPSPRNGGGSRTVLTERFDAMLGLVIFALRGMVAILDRDIQLSGADGIQDDRRSIWM